jgi:RNA polymerase sigma-70 factor, ECF subfamily
MTLLKLVHGTENLDDDFIKSIGRTDRRRAADLVIRKYRDPIFHHACHILKDYQEGIDVTQEVFIKAMREPRFFDDEFKMKAWLYRVTSNLCFNLVRNRKRRATILETMPLDTKTDPIQLEDVLDDERQSEILVAMDKISDDHRKILMLRYYNDLSYAEIGDVLEVKLGTVMSRLSRAKNRLMEVLDLPTVSER